MNIYSVSINDSECLFTDETKAKIFALQNKSVVETIYVNGEEEITQDQITENVVNKLRSRQRSGQAVYGQTLYENPKHEDPKGWLLELQEELLDGVQYIEKYLKETSP